MDREKIQKAYDKLVAKAWADEEFKARLLVEPMAVFKENGIEIPEEIEMRVVEDTDKVVNLILPPQPDRELSREELEAETERRTIEFAVKHGWQRGLSDK